MVCPKFRFPNLLHSAYPGMYFGYSTILCSCAALKTRCCWLPGAEFCSPRQPCDHSHLFASFLPQLAVCPALPQLLFSSCLSPLPFKHQTCYWVGERLRTTASIAIAGSLGEWISAHYFELGAAPSDWASTSHMVVCWVNCRRMHPHSYLMAHMHLFHLFWYLCQCHC